MSEIFEVIPDNSVHSNVERLLFQTPDEMCIVDNAQQQQLQQQQQPPKSRRRLRSRSRSRSRNVNAAATAATTVENNTKRNNNVNKSSIFRNVFPSSSSPTIAIATSPSPSRRANVSNVNNVKRLPPKPPLSKKWAFPKPYFSSCKENESPTLPSSMKLRDQEDPRMTKSYHPPSSASVTSAHNNNNNIGGMLYQKYHNSMDDAHGDDMHDTTALMSDDELSTQFHNSGPATVTGALSIGNSSSHYHHQHHYHDDYSVKSSDIYSYVSAQSQSQFGGTIGAVGGGGGGGVGGGFYNHYYYNDHYHHHHYDGGSTVGGGDGTTVAGGGGGTVKTFRTRGSQRSTRSAKTHKSVRRSNRRRKRKKVLKDWKMKMNDSLNLISKMSGFVIGGGAPSSPPHKDDHDGNHHHHYCPYNHVSDSDGGDQEEEDLYKSYHERQLHYMNNFHDEQENCAETNNNNTTSTNKVTSSNGLQFSPLRPKSTNMPFDETSPLRSSMHSPTGLLRPTRSFSDAVPPPVEAISSHSSFSRGTYSQNKGVAMLEKDNPSEQQQQEEEPAEYAQLMFGPGLGLCNGVEESSPPKKNTNSHSQNQNNPRPPQASSPNPRGVVNPSTKATPVVSVAQPSPQRSIKSTPNMSSPALSSPPRRTRTPPSATTSYHKTPNNGTQMNFNTPPSTPQRESASSSSGANGSTLIGKMLSTNHSTNGSTASPLSMTETIESLRSNPPPPPPLPPRREKQRSAPNPETLIGNRLPMKKSSSSPLSKDNTFQPATVTSNGIDKNTSNATTNDLPNSRMEAVPKTPPKGLSKHNSDNRHDKPRNPLPKASLPTDSPTTPTTAVTTASTPTKKIASSPTRNRNSLNTTSQVPSPNRNRAASSKIAPSPIRTKQQQQQQSLPTRRAAPVSTTVHKTIHRHNRHNKDADAYKRQTYGYGVPFGVYIHPTQSCDTSIDRERHDDELWETLGSPWDEDIVTVIKPHKSPQKKKYNRNHNYHHDQSCRNQPSVNNTKVKSKGGGVSTRKVAEYLYYKKSGDNGQKVTLKGTTAANGLSGSMHDSHPFDEGKHHQQHQNFKCQCVRCSAKSIYADLL